MLPPSATLCNLLLSELSSSHKMSFNCVMLKPVTAEMKITGRSSGRSALRSSISSSSSRSALVTARMRCLSSKPSLNCATSLRRISYSRRMLSVSPGTMKSKIELRSMWRRKRNPKPRPSAAPSMMPGMSAITNERPSR